ncbi:hypothetical protein H9L19_04735 [Weissella diestrammenae]|uniref:Uncharacterized protein n=1 Tax=Weissella diestrammenae TaxID=1162633 RepID=A0A7G9T3Q5_9LACO|nr:hypothetical protein [Weissella diestrammenae]MCM0582712.1 hypothetical protein [Weissella diestrammenae]QNN74730.1 hypothetical protein H9L19_04735 [Weissella diestrammenae]
MNFMKSKMSIGLLIIAIGLSVAVVEFRHLNFGLRHDTKQVKQTMDKQRAKQDVSLTSQSQKMLVQDTNIIRAKSTLQAFAKVFFSYNNQAVYDARLNDLSNMMQLTDEQKSSLFSSGLDRNGNSKINNLKLVSKYDAGTFYTTSISTDDHVIHVFGNVVVKAGSQDLGTKSSTVIMFADYDTSINKLTSVQIKKGME